MTLTTITDDDVTAEAAAFYVMLRRMTPAERYALRVDRLRMSRLDVAHVLRCSDGVIRRWEVEKGVGSGLPGPGIGLRYAELIVTHGAAVD